ncbi:MAG: ComEA family DNA-binding protein [Fusicatenibacter sp.]|nr:ComEA family DNA-binding protein [Lachnospiraceae bacterium]MDY2938167.1 ComEA family DNA-binding protein [Fusicatenibacter sp.]
MKNSCKRIFMLAFTLVFLLCSCNDTDTVYELKDDSESVTAVSGNQQNPTDEKTEEITVSGSSEEKKQGTQTGEKSELQVYICGAVQNPGVYTLTEGSRVVDAISAAGGLKSDACEIALNQARVLSDGEQIIVWTLEEAKNLGLDKAGALQSAADSADSADTSGEESGKVNLNRASKEQLMTLPGIGETRAEAILSYREQNGPFRQIEDIMNIDGIKEKMFEKIRGSIEV